MDPVISAEWVVGHLNDPTLRIVDCRFDMADPERGRREYSLHHLPGAIYVDLEKDLTGNLGEHGGRHPLPDFDLFAAKMGRLGISPEHKVVAYDDQWGEFAGRFWCLMHLLGHEEVYVLDGGLLGWEKRGYPVTSDLPAYPPCTYTPRIRAPFLAMMSEVKEKLGSPETLLIDSRERRRYMGETEPIDPIAGHIPGAKNFYYQEVINSEGSWKTPEQLKGHFGSIDPEKELIVYCGSGITACPNVISLMRAGFKKVRLYAGSWSDWISYRENPIATGED
ncbi:MAG: sulfurtransferase [Thermicanus sp.]|nr:sulfurtransferase [Thermicanus sp.]